MHRIYSGVGGMAIYPLAFNLKWLLNANVSDPVCEYNVENTLHFVKLWLNSLARNAGGATVLLIGTHKDQVVGGDDMAKSNADLASSSDVIARAHKLIGDCVSEMPDYTRKKLRLHMPRQPGQLHAISCLTVHYFFECVLLTNGMALCCR